MKRLLALAATLFLFTAPAHADTRYFSQIEDLPLAPGLAETEQAIGFSANGGGLVMSNAEGVATAIMVRDFYEAALPPLGWSESPGEDGELVFQRGRERLSLQLTQSGEHVRLHVQLVERPASMALD